MKLRLRWHGSYWGHRFLRAVQATLFAAGILALGFCALVYFQAHFSQVYEQRQFELDLALPPPASGHPLRATGLVSRLEIPRLGVSVMVHEGVGPPILRIGAGHIPGTAFPSEPGNVGIAAHRDTFFRDLRKVRANDSIVLTTLDGSYRYSVEWTRVVKPADIQVLASSERPVLTLVTCYPFYYIGSAPDRFIVRARRVGSTP